MYLLAGPRRYRLLTRAVPLRALVSAESFSQFPVSKRRDHYTEQIWYACSRLLIGGTRTGTNSCERNPV